MNGELFAARVLSVQSGALLVSHNCVINCPMQKKNCPMLSQAKPAVHQQAAFCKGKTVVDQVSKTEKKNIIYTSVYIYIRNN